MTLEQGIPILVAEDSKDNRLLLNAYCRGSEYQPTFAENGKEAIDAYLSGSFEIVIMDVHMPVLDGLSATRLIRGLETDKARKRTPILALTASAMAQDITLAREAGCDLHLPKPVSKQGFLTALKEWTPEANLALAQRQA